MMSVEVGIGTKFARKSFDIDDAVQFKVGKMFGGEMCFINF